MYHPFEAKLILVNNILYNLNILNLLWVMMRSFLREEKTKEEDKKNENISSLCKI